MSLREDLLRENRGSVSDAAAILAYRLTLDDPDNYKVGYTIPNAILAARDVFPEVSEETIRFLNARSGWMVEE